MRMVEIADRYYVPTNIMAVYKDEDEEGTVLELVGTNATGGANRIPVPIPTKEVVGMINDALSGGTS